MKLLHLYVCHLHALQCWGICHVRETVWRNIVSIDRGLVMLIVGHFNSSAGILGLRSNVIGMASVVGSSFYSHAATLGSWSWATKLFLPAKRLRANLRVCCKGKELTMVREWPIMGALFCCNAKAKGWS